MNTHEILILLAEDYFVSARLYLIISLIVLDGWSAFHLGYKIQ